MKLTADDLAITPDQFKALMKQFKTMDIEVQPNIVVEILEALKHNSFDNFMTALRSSANLKEAIWKGEEFNTSRAAISREIKILKSKPIGAITEMTCRKCQVIRQVEFITAQKRSADEGETVTYTCLTCGEKWKNNG